MSDVNFDKLLGMEMVFVKGGTFKMGGTKEQGNDCHDLEKPVHKVTLSDYNIGKYQVTQKLWREVVGSNPSLFVGDDFPVVNVSWNDINNKFLPLLNKATRREYRLPTEAEWEYAARGGSKSKNYKFSGSNDIEAVAWYTNNSGGKVHEVGTKAANELGIYDMSGNVWEWVNDWYGEYSSDAQTNPKGPSRGPARMTRGGCWYGSTLGCRVSARIGNEPDSNDDNPM